MARMTRWGVGPWFAACWLASAAAAAWLRWRHPEMCSLGFMPRWLLLAAGGVLAAAGLVLWIAGVMAVQRAYTVDKLCTTGVCGLCRHPIYASWAVLVAPGLGFLLNCWAFWIASALMYVVLRALVRKEEAYLEDRFGEVYREYKRRVPAALPLGWLRRS